MRRWLVRRRLKRRRLLWWRLLRRRLLLLLVRRRWRDRGLGTTLARAGPHRSAVLIEAHAWRRGAEIVEAAAAAAPSAPVEAATATAPASEPIPRHVCNQGAVEAEAEKTFRKRGGHLASQGLFSICTECSNIGGLVTSQVTQMTPKPQAAQGPLNINCLGWFHIFHL